MILYLDTSALVKLFLDEAGRELTIGAVAASSEVCTSAIAYAEARATFARKLREEVWAAESHRLAVAALEESWQETTLLEVSLDLAKRAGVIAQTFALRGYDAAAVEAGLTQYGAEPEATS